MPGHRKRGQGAALPLAHPRSDQPNVRRSRRRARHRYRRRHCCGTCRRRGLAGYSGRRAARDTADRSDGAAASLVAGAGVTAAWPGGGGRGRCCRRCHSCSAAAAGATGAGLGTLRARRGYVAAEGSDLRIRLRPRGAHAPRRPSRRRRRQQRQRCREGCQSCGGLGLRLAGYAAGLRGLSSRNCRHELRGHLRVECGTHAGAALGAAAGAAG
mmetsp:Transcript_110226/g.355456  ORF Transcript_110226/g.355456 Transcript_110226/m.355456 type:complete len:213 (+) Transcript_110226:452-1090(+)